MALFGFFGSKKTYENMDKKSLQWKKLTSLRQLESLRVESETKTVVIFKHSTSCGISRMVKRTFEANYNYKSEEVSLYFLDLLAFREVSNEVANKFNVIHQSPQILVIQNGIVVHHASHQNVRAEDIQNYL